MFAFTLGGPELMILLVIVLVLFGGSQLPKLARNLGKAQKELKEGMEESSSDSSDKSDKSDTSEAADS
jgi:sec-independent protein translocase protein TatA